MTQHSIESTQQLSMYGVTVCLRQTRLYEIEVSFEGGTHDDGSEVKSFPNMAEALAYVARIAQDLEDEEGDDWGVDEDDDTFPEFERPKPLFEVKTVRIECLNSLRFDEGTTTGTTRALTDEQLRDIAKGGIERHLGDVVEEGMSVDEQFDHAYVLAHSALVDRGIDARTASRVAQEVATELVQP